jgi:G8 domain
MNLRSIPRLIGQPISVALGLTFALGLVACNPSSSASNPVDGSGTNNSGPNNSSTDTTGNVASSAKWSDPKTWGGTVPAAGSDVTIPADKAVLLDQNVNLKNLTVMGKLEFADQNLELNAASIMLHGTLRVGTSLKPFTKGDHHPDGNEHRHQQHGHGRSRHSGHGRHARVVWSGPGGAVD